MSLAPRPIKHYHVFLASPGDVGTERQHVRKFFDDYNGHTARIWNVQFDVIDWENYSTIGVGRPQELITKQTLEKYRDSLALVVGIMGQRFGSPSGKTESGTEEEFNWAMESHKQLGYPEIKWFFRKTDKLEMPTDPAELLKAAEQWGKVLAFRKRMQDFSDPVFAAEYHGADGFSKVFDRDLLQWLSDPARQWVTQPALAGSPPTTAPSASLSSNFDSSAYRSALLKRFDKLNFEMLDTTGAFYSGVRLWSVFVPQSVRECHEYNPRLLEIPKEHQRRLLDAGTVTAAQLAQLKAAEAERDRRQREYFNQPRRDVIDVTADTELKRIVILGDPGSGKSSLMRYLALRWAQIENVQLRAMQPLPLLMELGAYGRWQCDGKKGFLRFLEEASNWHPWDHGALQQLVKLPGRAVLLLDGLDEIFDVKTHEAVINDIQSFSSDYPHIHIIVTSRVVGYRMQRLRDAKFRHFMLQDLDADQIEAFVDHWHDETFDKPEEAAPKRERLKKAIRSSKPIAMLAGNPLLLTMMAILNRNQELPRDRAELYQQASRVLLHQWDTERALENYPELRGEVDLRAKTDMLRSVAAAMQNGPDGLKGNIIDGRTLTELIERYLREELHFDQSRAAAAAVVRQLRERNFILCFVGTDSYAFVHRTFLEYFCAADLVHRFNNEQSLIIDDLIAHFDKYCRDDEWREVLQLICGQIDEQFVGRIVEHLTTRTELQQWNGEVALPELPLAIWCLGAARNLNRLAEPGGKLLAVIFDCFMRGKGFSYSFVDEFIAAAKDIGARGPGKSAFQFSGQYPGTYMGLYSLYWPHFLAAVFEQRSWIHDLAYCDNFLVRWGSLSTLGERWPDDSTRQLLTERTVEDGNETVRKNALQTLAEKWPDDITRKLLVERARVDGSAAAVFGRQHSEFGRMVWSSDIDGMAPYLDPRKPISRAHIEQAAQKAGVAAEQINEMVCSLSEHLGWDITQSAGPNSSNGSSCAS
jgi:hypothetical protein